MYKCLNLILLIFVFVLTPCNNINAQTRLSVDGAGRLYPIAVPQLCLEGIDSEARKSIPEKITRNLDISGYFQVLNSNMYIESPGKCSAQDGFAYSDWSVLGVEGLVKGIVTSAGGGNLRIQMFLHDVQVKKVVLGKEYTADPGQLNKIADKFSNEIMKFFTGIEGIFGSQISYSSKVGRFKELFVANIDGTDVRQLTNDRGLAVSSSWNRNGRELLYTSYKRRIPNIFSFDLNSKRVRQITNDSMLQVGARTTPDGNIVLSRTAGKESDIVTISSSGTVLRNLTKNNGAIDVSPSFSPRGDKIAFVSNRAGSPQVYVMNSDGSGADRISFVNSNYCTSPDWSPQGDLIVFVCRGDRGFQLYTINPNGGNARQLTSRGKNEDPSWSPDGRYIVFSSNFGKSSIYNLAIIRKDGSNMKQISFGRSGDFDPSWGPVPK